MDFERLIALSHLRSRRQDRGISLIAVLSVTGVMVGVAALIIVLSVMQGFEVELRDAVLGNQAHVIVLKYGGPIDDIDETVATTEATPGVVSAVPFVYTEVMLKSTFGVGGAALKGFDPTRVAGTLELAEDIETGPRGTPATTDEKLAIVRNLRTPEPAIAQDIGDTEMYPGMMLGKGLAEDLRVYPGDRIFVINPIGGGYGALGVPVPTTRTFRVAAIIHTGMYEFDSKWAYITMADAQEFMNMPNMATAIEVKVESEWVDRAPEMAVRIEDQLGGLFHTKNWLTTHSALFRALETEKWVMGLILAQIVSVAALGIVTNLIVMVITRAREISILKAMGASASMVRAIFVMEGATVGVVGTGLGVALGLAGCALLDWYHYELDTNVYYLDSLPVVVVPETVAIVAAVSLLICFLATIYPSGRAALIDPVDGLRYE